jgi:class 3 adenylate cyclase
MGILAWQYKTIRNNPSFIIAALILCILPFFRKLSKIRSSAMVGWITGTIFYICVFIISCFTELGALNALVSLTLIYRLNADKTVFDNLAILSAHFSAVRDYQIRPRLFLVGSFIFGTLLSHQLRKKLHTVWDSACLLLICRQSCENEFDTAKRILRGIGPEGSMASLKPDEPITPSKGKTSQGNKSSELSESVREGVKVGVIPGPKDFDRLHSSARSRMNQGLKRYPLAIVAFKSVVSTEHECMFQSVRDGELFSIIDKFAANLDVFCVRRVGRVWVGCVGFSTSLGSGSIDCNRAIALAILVYTSARNRHIAVTAAIGYGTVTGGYVGSSRFDLFGEEVRWALDHVELRRNEILVSDVVHFMVEKKREKETLNLFKFEVSVVPSVIVSAESEKVFVVVPLLTNDGPINCMLGVECMLPEAIPLRWEARDQDSYLSPPVKCINSVICGTIRELLQFVYFDHIACNGSNGGSMEFIVSDGGGFVNSWMLNPEKVTQQHYEVVTQLFLVVKRTLYPSALRLLLLTAREKVLRGWGKYFKGRFQIKSMRNGYKHSVRVSDPWPRNSYHRGNPSGPIERRVVDSSEDMVSSTRAVNADRNSAVADSRNNSIQRSVVSICDEGGSDQECAKVAEDVLFTPAVLSRIPPAELKPTRSLGHICRFDSGGSIYLEAPSMDTIDDGSYGVARGKSYSVDNTDNVYSMLQTGTDGPVGKHGTSSSSFLKSGISNYASEMKVANQFHSSGTPTTLSSSTLYQDDDGDDSYFLLADVARDLFDYDDPAAVMEAWPAEDELKGPDSGDSQDVVDSSLKEAGARAQQLPPLSQVQQHQHQTVPRSNMNYATRISSKAEALTNEPLSETDPVYKMKMYLKHSTVLRQLPQYNDLMYESSVADTNGDTCPTVQTFFYAVPFVIMGFTSYFSMGQLNMQEGDLITQLIKGMCYLLYLLLPVIVVETRGALFTKHSVLLGLQIYLMYSLDHSKLQSETKYYYYMTSSLESNRDDSTANLAQGHIILGIFLVHCLHHNYLPFWGCVLSNILLVAALVALFVTSDRNVGCGSFLYFLFVVLFHGIRWAMEFVHLSYFALVLDILPYLIERYETMKLANRNLLSGHTNYVPLVNTNILHTPRRYRNAAVVAMHVKAVELVPDFLEEKDTSQFLTSLYRVIDECIADAGMLKVSSFSGVIICVSCEDPYLCNVESLRKPINYATRAVMLLLHIQRRIDSYFKDDQLKINLGMGINHGSITLGLLGGNCKPDELLYFDCGGSCRDLAYLLATNRIRQGFYASDIYKNLIIHDSSTPPSAASTSAATTAHSTSGAGGVGYGTNGSTADDCYYDYEPNSRMISIQFENSILSNWGLHLDRSFNGIQLQDFEYICELGKGGYGTVHLVQEKEYAANSNSKKKKKFYAIKKLPIHYESSKMIRREFLILQQMQHFNVIHFMYCMVYKKSIYLVMSFVKCGNLQQIVSSYLDLSIDTFRFWFAELIIALEYVHSLGIIHRDVKPTNCMIGETVVYFCADCALLILGSLQMNMDI